MIYWIIGLSGSGKTTLGRVMHGVLKAQQPNTVFIDGDDIRSHFGNPGHTMEGRRKNADFICRLCKWLDSQGMNVVCCILSVFKESREWNRKNYSKYFEIYMDVPMDILKKRDKKGIYTGKIKNVIGADVPFEPPKNPDYVFNNTAENIDFGMVAKAVLSQAGRKK